MVKRKVLQYTVKVTRQSTGWSASWADGAAEVRARNLRSLDGAVRAAITAAGSKAAGEPEITYDYHLGDAHRLWSAIRDVAHRRMELAAAEAELATRTAKAAHDLVGSGLSFRDAATLLGVSHQRIAQLLADDGA